MPLFTGLTLRLQTPTLKPWARPLLVIRAFTGSDDLWRVPPLGSKTHPLSPSSAPIPSPARFLPPEPVLANDVTSCENPSDPGPSGSTRDTGAEAEEDTRAEEGSSSRIVNGTDCELHAQPWQGALLLQPNQLYCGAVLVNPQWLLTAAHCWKP